MKHVVQMYLEDQKLAWSPSTLRSEAARLEKHHALLALSPEQAWAALESLKPYTRVTTWTRLTKVMEWAIAHGHHAGPNLFSLFRIKNARLFKHAYVRKPAEIGFDTAKLKIETIANPAIRRRALLLLMSGLRYSEISKVIGGLVVGKGGKTRTVHLPQIAGPEYTGTYHHFWRTLASVGLKPHLLRKIALTRLVELGADQFELCELAGWASINTASSYIKANDGRTKRLMEELQS
jgi:hypothetical protein